MQEKAKKLSANISLLQSFFFTPLFDRHGTFFYLFLS